MKEQQVTWNDVFAWGEEVAQRAGITRERSRELLREVRAMSAEEIQEAVGYSVITIAALKALSRLRYRIVLELDRYRKHVGSLNDEARLVWVGWAEEWLENGGREIYNQLRQQILEASPTEQREMIEAIEAAEQMFDVDGYPKTIEEWDCILDWGRGALVALKRGFRRFGKVVKTGQQETDSERAGHDGR